MWILAFALSALLQQCAPSVGPRTMAAIIRVESGGNPFAIHDNTSGRSFFPASALQATVLANQLLALHHSVDLGMSQINSGNLPGIGLSVSAAFDACSNIHAGAGILSQDYRVAARRFGPGQFALRRALGAYNTGSIYAGSAYVEKILEAAHSNSNSDMRYMPMKGFPHSRQIANRPVIRKPRDPYSAPMMIQVSSVQVSSTKKLLIVSK